MRVRESPEDRRAPPALAGRAARLQREWREQRRLRFRGKRREIHQDRKRHLWIIHNPFQLLDKLLGIFPGNNRQSSWSAGMRRMTFVLLLPPARSVRSCSSLKRYNSGSPETSLRNVGSVKDFSKARSWAAFSGSSRAASAAKYAWTAGVT